MERYRICTGYSCQLPPLYYKARPGNWTSFKASTTFPFVLDFISASTMHKHSHLHTYWCFTKLSILMDFCYFQTDVLRLLIFSKQQLTNPDCLWNEVKYEWHKIIVYVMNWLQPYLYFYLMTDKQLFRCKCDISHNVHQLSYLSARK